MVASWCIHFGVIWFFLMAGQGNLGALEEGAYPTCAGCFWGIFRFSRTAAARGTGPSTIAAFFRRAPWSTTWSIATGGRGCGSTSMDWILGNTGNSWVLGGRTCVFVLIRFQGIKPTIPTSGHHKNRKNFQNIPFVSFDVIWCHLKHSQPPDQFLSLPGPGKPRKPLTLQWLWWFAKFWWRARILPRHKGRFEGSKDHWWMEMDRNQHVF